MTRMGLARSLVAAGVMGLVACSGSDNPAPFGPTDDSDLDPVFGDGPDKPSDPIGPGDGDVTPEKPDAAKPDPDVVGDAGLSDAGDKDANAPDACDPPNQQVLEPSSLPTCDLCDGARCVPNSIVTDQQRELLAACDDGSVCVPDNYVATGGDFLLASCRSLAGVEGRCVSTCVPRVAAQADRLPQDVCEEGELCAPCFDPITGDDTGSCGQSCDPGPAEEKVVFDSCCGGLAVCVPTEMVPEDRRGQLDQGDCSGDGQLCAPTNQAADPDFLPKSCFSLADAEGRCLPACLPAVAARAGQLPQAVCAAGELCAPCFDPISGASTGACSQGADSPKRPPVVFDGCCDDGSGQSLGTCLPSALVPSDQLSLLAADTCAGAGAVCAPTSFADGSYTATTCSAVGGVEGRCLPGCLPDVSARAGSLEQDVCAGGNLCVPCYDPLSGEATGACDLFGDAPVDPPSTFEACCDDGASGKLGTCVPDTLVPSEQVSLLGADTCSQAGMLCAPTEIANGTYAPVTCQSYEGAEGRCLPGCLPDVAARAGSLTQDSCTQGKLCVPCFDPITGADTGACGLAGDAPTQPPVAFPSCCDDGTGTTDLGICVPTPAVPEAQASLLGPDRCTGEALCAPTEVAAGTYAPKVCQSWLASEGRCLPACLPPVATRASQLTQDNCDTGELCVPCFDPLTGASTSACELPGDAPASTTPTTFPTCCPTDGVDRGTCVPKTVAGSQGDVAPVLDCETATNDADAYVCAPNEKVADPSFKFPSCQTSCAGLSAADAFICANARALIGNASGACLPACMLAEQVILGVTPVFGRSTCATGEVCAPCNLPAISGGGSSGACD